jgi:glycosyltransferase involved in cell wall biosynthesis
MHSSTKNHRVAFSVTNCICYDQRVLKMAEILSALNCHITIIGRNPGDCCDSGAIPFRTKRFRMIFRKGFLFYKFFNIRLFFYLLLHKFDLLVANDLDTLLPNFLTAKFKTIPLVYDSHEYFTGLPEIQHRPFVKWVWTTIEKMIFPKLKYVITVSEPIAGLYEEKYGIKCLIVRNFSKKADHIVPFERVAAGIPEDDLLVIIQGTGINVDKGAGELIEAISMTEGVFLLVVGSGNMLISLKKQVDKLNLKDRVKFIHRVMWDELMKYTRMSDVGMCLEKNTNLNYRYSLPNKLFDYISAGIPVIASNLPETGKVISGTGCGMLVDNVTPEAISNALSELIMNPAKLAELRKNAVIASSKINWDTEKIKVSEFYRMVLNMKTGL